MSPLDGPTRKERRTMRHKTNPFRYYDKTPCDYCGGYPQVLQYGKLVDKKQMNKVHVNVNQDQTHHFFCNDDCKLNWLFNKKKKGGKKK